MLDILDVKEALEEAANNRNEKAEQNRIESALKSMNLIVEALNDSKSSDYQISYAKSRLSEVWNTLRPFIETRLNSPEEIEVPALLH